MICCTRWATICIISLWYSYFLILASFNRYSSCTSITRCMTSTVRISICCTITIIILFFICSGTTSLCFCLSRYPFFISIYIYNFFFAFSSFYYSIYIYSFRNIWFLSNYCRYSCFATTYDIYISINCFGLSCCFYSFSWFSFNKFSLITIFSISSISIWTTICCICFRS